MKEAYIVQGGKPLKGEIIIEGAKNAAIKLMIAALLFEGDVIIEKVPRILDVDYLLKLIHKLGADAYFKHKNTLVINKKGMNTARLDLYFASKIRSSFLMFAPLLYAFERAEIPNPGGCRLGARSIDRIINAMQQLSIKIEYNLNEEYYISTLLKMPQGTCIFEKPSHTGTELLLMIAAKSPNEIIITNASTEPEVDDMIKFLNKGGACIKRKGNAIVSKGSSVLKQKEPHQLMGDRLVAATYAVSGVVTKGNVVVKGIDHKLMQPLNNYFLKANVGIEILEEQTIRYFYKGDFHVVDKVSTDVYPGFMTDIQPLWALLMTQANGSSIIQERLFENRFSYVEEIKKLGAVISFIDIPVENPETFYLFNYDKTKIYPHQAIKIQGPTPFHNGVLQMMDIRAGATVALAALMAEGESVVHGIQHMQRGYANITENLIALGADIKEI
ncbi:MAG: UDP-N-acetylglucosamine 1-carboxyvinyltransferase [Chitinophagaceae bacterium]